MEMNGKILAIGLLLLLAKLASAGTIPQMNKVVELNLGLKTVAAALGMLVIAYSGLRWVTAEGPQERDDAKKTIIYVIIGLIVVSLANELVQALYCETLSSTGMSC